MPRFVFVSFVAFLVVALGAAVLGCEAEPAPQLISVTELTPREAEVGDKLEITGAGFPQGKAARIAFRGTLYRPGERPARGAVIDADGTVVGRDSIEVAYTEALDAEFCGIADHRRHTTFEGDLEVSFAAASKGAPPVTAVLHQVTLDLRPPEDSPSVIAERAAEGEKTLAAIGIHGTEPTGERGLRVAKVDAGSRAEEAGILADDVLVGFAGVRIGKLADVVIPSGVRDVEITLRRGAAAREEKRTVHTLGVDRSIPTDVFGAAFIAIAATLVVLLFFTPSRGPITWLEKRFASAPRSSVAPHAPPRRERLMVAITVSLCFALLTLLSSLSTASRSLIAELDVPTFAIVSWMTLATLALLAGGSLTNRLRGVFTIVTFELPVVLALIGAVSIAGSLRLRDIASVQGGWPWEWIAFRSPPAFLLFLAFLASTTKERFSPAARGIVSLAEQVHVLALAGLCAAVFLGGWTLPMLAPGAQRTNGFYALLGCVLFLAKMHGIAHLVARGRRMTSAIETRMLIGLAWRWLVPLSAAALGACMAWAYLRIHPEMESLVAAVDVVLALLLIVRLGVRTGSFGLQKVRGGGTAEPHLNPFL
ncbi:NADH-quinone oxidoreductase subunit H [Pendulispora brunnea]|uniref:NADH-quinone oxidoreductase subunit H n=1 Tax=Pendulispora brunnea TaxID=2905690 RepID=A0ABZ2K232_9BACT